jgi:hypothetical protein
MLTGRETKGAREILISVTAAVLGDDFETTVPFRVQYPYEVDLAPEACVLKPIKHLYAPHDEECHVMQLQASRLTGIAVFSEQPSQTSRFEVDVTSFLSIRSSNPSVARVEGSGHSTLVHGSAPGSTQIIAYGPGGIKLSKYTTEVMDRTNLDAAVDVVGLDIAILTNS